MQKDLVFFKRNSNMVCLIQKYFVPLWRNKPQRYEKYLDKRNH